MNDLISVDDKLEEIKKKIWFWQIKENPSKEEICKINETFEIHWKFINLLNRTIDKEWQFKREREDLIDNYWKLTNEKEIEEKKESELQIQLINEKREELNNDEEIKKIKKVGFKIDPDLKKKIDGFIKENFLTFNLFVNEALKYYKNEMPSNFELENSETKIWVFASLNYQTIKIYDSIVYDSKTPKKERKFKLETILRSYLEIKLEKDLINKYKYKYFDDWRKKYNNILNS